MKLAIVFIVTIGVGVLFYPITKTSFSKPFFADKKDGKTEKNPKPSEPPGRKISRTEFAANINDKNYRIVVNIPATKLYLYENEDVVMEFPVAVGQVIYKTPVGTHELNDIVWNPWWYPPKSDWAKDEVVTPPGPKNPLGPVKMELGDEIRIHGTSKPSSIGRAASHACIRMKSADATKLAWYLQTKLTEKDDESFLAKYKKFSTTTFHVKLNKAVQVNMIYEPVAFQDDELTIYPDLYGKVKDVKMLAEWKLFSSGINPWNINLGNIEKPKRSPLQIGLRKDILYTAKKM